MSATTAKRQELRELYVSYRQQLEIVERARRIAWSAQVSVSDARRIRVMDELIANLQSEINETGAELARLGV